MMTEEALAPSESQGVELESFGILCSKRVMRLFFTVDKRLWRSICLI
jgi:hypothetical protein